MSKRLREFVSGYTHGLKAEDLGLLVRGGWRLGISAPEVMLHQRTLALALQSRDTLLQALAKATQFAVKLAQLSLLLGTPGGVILALPVAWKFINEVLAEVGQP